MQRYICDKCGWVYHPKDGAPEQGIRPKTPFEDLPKHFQCAKCGVGREQFSPEPPDQR